MRSSARWCWPASACSSRSLINAGLMKDWFQPSFTLRILLPDEGVSGLAPGAEVQVLGTRAGEVRRIVIDPNQRMHAVARVEDQMRPFIKRDFGRVDPPPVRRGGCRLYRHPARRRARARLVLCRDRRLHRTGSDRYARPDDRRSARQGHARCSTKCRKPSRLSLPSPSASPIRRGRWSRRWPPPPASRARSRVARAWRGG